jgi:predicted RNase H-like nuclease (RuvC/YqgF family)
MFSSCLCVFFQVTELNTHIQGLTAILTEKNRQIESLRREKERFMSQNRLAVYRADGERKMRSSF